MLKIMKLILCVCIVVIIGLIGLSVFSSTPSSSTFQSLVSQTHHQLSQLHKLKQGFEDQPLDNALLTELGFVQNPILYPKHTWPNLTTPVVVSAVSSWDLGHLPDLLKVVHMLMLDVLVVIYMLDLTQSELDAVKDICNKTCLPIPFDFSSFPSHVRDLKLAAHRAIIIQEMLQRAGIIFWLDPCMRILETFSTTSPSEGAFDEWLRNVLQNGGVLTWALGAPAPHLPTSAFTHPDMFPAFRTYKHNYDFQQMSDPKAILIVNTPLIHRRLMRPWVSCSLTASCLSPIGAQDTGCNYNKKPLFRYSGCHLYDVSAFNVALGLAFGMNDDSYLDATVKFVCLTSPSGHLQPTGTSEIFEALPHTAVKRNKLGRRYHVNDRRTISPRKNKQQKMLISNNFINNSLKLNVGTFLHTYRGNNFRNFTSTNNKVLLNSTNIISNGKMEFSRSRKLFGQKMGGMR